MTINAILPSNIRFWYVGHDAGGGKKKTIVAVVALRVKQRVPRGTDMLRGLVAVDGLPCQDIVLAIVLEQIVIVHVHRCADGLG